MESIAIKNKYEEDRFFEATETTLFETNRMRGTSYEQNQEQNRLRNWATRQKPDSKQVSKAKRKMAKESRKKNRGKK